MQTVRFMNNWLHHLIFCLQVGIPGGQDGSKRKDDGYETIPGAKTKKPIRPAVHLTPLNDANAENVIPDPPRARVSYSRMVSVMSTGGRTEEEEEEERLRKIREEEAKELQLDEKAENILARYNGKER